MYFYGKKDMPAYTKDKTLFCALNRIFGFKPSGIKAMIEDGAPPESLLPDDATRKGTISWAEDEISRCIGLGISIVTIADPEYPAALKECPDAPLLLYIRGTWPEGKKALSVVGTRHPDEYGLRMCDRIIDSVHRTGNPPVIISGLAYGVDVQAHKRTLLRQGTTVAVMGTGADRIYPKSHEWLAGKIMEHGGCLISDFPLGEAPLPVNFLKRNRIIAGLSECTVVIQSPKKGGSMVTATQAFSYGRDVYAIPGRLDDGKSEGCNYLIAAEMAGCICDTDRFSLYFREEKDVTASHNGGGGNHRAGDCCIFGGEDGDMEKILRILSDGGGKSTEFLLSETGMAIENLTAALTELEIDGKICKEDGFNWSIKIK